MISKTAGAERSPNSSYSMVSELARKLLIGTPLLNCKSEPASRAPEHAAQVNIYLYVRGQGNTIPARRDFLT
jgi:hypothetical protein